MGSDKKGKKKKKNFVKCIITKTYIYKIFKYLIMKPDF